MVCWWLFPTAQVCAQAPPTPTVTKQLLDKADTLEASGRMDLAVQTWLQVLLADPKNPGALAGLARAAALNGNSKLAESYLERLKAVSPNDPNINRIQNTPSQADQNARLKQAAKLAAAGQNAAAMAIYRQVLGPNPAPTERAFPYYQTEAVTEDGRPHAIAGMRALVAKFPANSRYQIALGRLLATDAKTRDEGQKILERFSRDPQAQLTFRQSLLADAANPAKAPEIRAYLATHPDPQLALALQTSGGRSAPKAAAVPPVETAARPASAPAEPAATHSVSAETAAYQALNAKRLDDAEAQFKALLQKEPANSNALAGMGYVRMQQGNFVGAISYLEQARQGSPDDKALATALDTARFWFLIGEAQSAFIANDLTAAGKNYRASLELRPDSPEALAGLAGTLLKSHQPSVAIPVFQRVVAAQPESVGAWRGLVIAQVQAGSATDALATARRIPPAVHAQLEGDPIYLQALASAYSASGRVGDAQTALESALRLPLPATAKAVKADIEVQLAGVFFTGNQLDQAAGLYSQVLADDPSNIAAWQGLAQVQHIMGHDQEALQTLQKMPPASYAEAIKDPGFVVTVAKIDQAANNLDAAQDVLQAAVTQASNAGQRPSPGIRLQLASVSIARGTPQLAYPIYLQLIRENPNNADAWAGLLATLHLTGHDSDVLAQLPTIPPVVRAQLETNVSYLQTMASVYGAQGRSREGTQFIGRAEQNYAAEGTPTPADVEIQKATLLLNGMDDAGLYRQLMSLGGRTDLTEQQRSAVQSIWTKWAARRASQAAADGNSTRALAILSAAVQSFPNDPAAMRGLANGYAHAGQSQQALDIYKTQNMTSVSAEDYKAAISSAMTTGDTKDADAWLHLALTRYPSDPQILILGARYEQSRGDTSRAMEYFRASLKAMPPPSATAESKIILPSVSQPQYLSGLLAPPASAPVETSPAPGNDTDLAVPEGDNLTVAPPPVAAPPDTHSTGGAFVAPTRPVAPVASADPRTANASPVTVQLGNSAAPPVQPESEMTDVLPTARYVPNANAKTDAADPNAAAAQAARIRRLQAESASAAAGQPHSVPETDVTGVPQVAQPATPPGKASEIPDTGSQQYPQPRTRPAPAAQSARSRPASPPPAPVPEPAAVITPIEPTPPETAQAEPVPAVAATPAPNSSAAIQSYPLPTPPTDAELAARIPPPPPNGYFAPRGSRSPPPRVRPPRPRSPRSKECTAGGLGGLASVGIAMERLASIACTTLSRRSRAPLSSASRSASPPLSSPYS